ncbi:Piwi domain-containing protein, partial [Mycena polygramma]
QEHYLKTYQITLSFPYTIGVVTSGKGAPFKVVIPLELCMMVPGQLYKKRLPPDATAAVVGFGAVTPAQRLQMILTGGGAQTRSPVQDFQNSEFMVDAGMQVGQTALSVRGRLLPVSPLIYKGRQSPHDGAWNVLGSQFYTPTQMLNWAVINFDPHRIIPGLVDKTINMIIECCSKLGRSLFLYLSIFADICQPSSACLLLTHRIVTDVKPPKSIYTCIKFVCDTALGVYLLTFVSLTSSPTGVRSQCLREPKLQKANNQYFNNVGTGHSLQLNARLGGANALVDSKALINMASQPMMILGADVSHPAPGVNRPSVASLVWSHDRYGAAYCATTGVQSPRTEIIADLKNMVKIAIIVFGDKHKMAPVNVLFLRDGVSEGESA